MIIAERVGLLKRPRACSGRTSKLVDGSSKHVNFGSGVSERV